MITTLNQRWRDRRGSYRPAGEVIRTSEYEVAPMPGDADAKSFVEQHHYSGSFPAARFRYGLHRGANLVGVAVFSQPMNNAALRPLPVDADSVELGRFVLLDGVPGNGETWFLARCFEHLKREGMDGVVSFSDPVARTDAAGTQVFGGHIGTIYQAHNAVYLGRGTARTLRILPDGSVFSDRAASKVRKRERGWRYASAQLVAHGAVPLADDENSAAWLNLWLDRLARRTKHAGNHKYVWAFSHASKRALPTSLTYPKLDMS